MFKKWVKALVRQMIRGRQATANRYIELYYSHRFDSQNKSTD